MSAGIVVVPETYPPAGMTCVACEKPIRNGYEKIAGRGPYHVRCAKREREA